VFQTSNLDGVWKETAKGHITDRSFSSTVVIMGCLYCNGCRGCNVFDGQRPWFRPCLGSMLAGSYKTTTQHVKLSRWQLSQRHTVINYLGSVTAILQRLSASKIMQSHFCMSVLAQLGQVYLRHIGQHVFGA
jgi:hypothetical protein